MYRCILNVAVYSSNDLIFEAIKDLIPIKNFEYNISLYEELSKQTIKNNDIIILDLPFEIEDLKNLFSLKKETSLIVLCAKNNDIINFDSSYFSLIDDLWVKPVNKNLIVFLFNKILKQLKLQKDYQMTQKYLDTTIDTIPDLVWYKDIKGKYVKVNQSFCDTVNKTEEDIKNKKDYYIWGIDQDNKSKTECMCLKSDEIVLKEKKTLLFDEKIKYANEMRQLKTYKSPIFDDNLETIGTVGIARDVTGLQNIEIELETLIQNMPFAILIIDKNEYIINANNRYLDIFSVEKDEVIGKKLDIIRIKCFCDKKWHFRSGHRGNYLYGNDKILKIQKETLVDIFGEIAGYIHLYIDITFEDNYENKLLKAANTDFLTKLNNRRGLNKFVEEHYCNQKCALMLIDLDNFKNVNDNHGHVEGDQLLVEFANILLELFPNSNVFRLGGDEFLVIFIDIIEKDNIEKYANAIINKFKNIIDNPNDNILSVSMGIAINSDTFLDFRDLFKRADIALYKAKGLGKSQYSFWEKETKTLS